MFSSPILSSSRGGPQSCQSRLLQPAHIRRFARSILGETSDIARRHGQHLRNGNHTSNPSRKKLSPPSLIGNLARTSRGGRQNNFVRKKCQRPGCRENRSSEA